MTQENLLENFDKFFLCAIVKIYLDLFFISLKQPNTLLKRTHRPAGAKWHQCRDQKRLISFSAFNIQHVDVKMSTSHKWGITQSKHHLFESQKTLFSPKPLTVLTETTRHSWGQRTNCPRSERPLGPACWLPYGLERIPTSYVPRLWRLRSRGSTILLNGRRRLVKFGQKQHRAGKQRGRRGLIRCVITMTALWRAR